MPKVALGKAVPDIELDATGGRKVKFSDYRGTNIVLYFYPKDNTPGCTVEGKDFRDNYTKFKRAGAEVLGVSRDSVKSHENFSGKFQFPFPLLSDDKERLCKAFDVIKSKNMYGKQVMGIERSTFLIDAEGVLQQEWRKVKVDGHVLEVLAAVKALNK